MGDDAAAGGETIASFANGLVGGVGPLGDDLPQQAAGVGSTSDCGSERRPSKEAFKKEKKATQAARRSRVSAYGIRQDCGDLRKPAVEEAGQDGQVGAAQLGTNMFADSDALRQGIRADLAKQAYNVADFYHETGVFQAIAKSRHFGNITLFVIAINAIWMGLDVDCNDEFATRYLDGCPAQPYDTDFWQAGEHFFCTFFTLELAIRFGAFRTKCDSLKDNWFKFDSLLVSFMVLETWILPVFQNGEGGGDFSNLSILKMLRLLRLTRMVRLMRSVPELVTLLKGMAIATRSVSYTLLLLLIFMYIFAIVFKSQLAFAQNPNLRRLFRTIPRSMWTLMLSGCMLDDTTFVADLLIEESAFLSMVFVFFILLACLMVLNMLIGVLCAVVTAVAAAEKEKVLVGYVKARLMSVLETLDQDGNGTISQAEFDQLIHIDEAVNALEELGVDVTNLASLSEHLFDAEEADDKDENKAGGHGSSGGEHSEVAAAAGQEAPLAEGEEEEEEHEISMTFADFLEMVIRLRADNTPSVLDIVELRKLCMKGQNQVNKRFAHIQRGQTELQKGIQDIFASLEIAERGQTDVEMELAIKNLIPSSSVKGFGATASAFAPAVQAPLHPEEGPARCVPGAGAPEEPRREQVKPRGGLNL
eukprot:TRINITY_DN15596_c0_g1_i5.p1 TRINITY_DN15596_c0_g1~~TRINITY_DN15596_c0_g1_i5.p1  ORF type:complete len:646 (-),score=163.85 TRINITY_DN15596_c0_g1_i5:341-2278(-)